MRASPFLALFVFATQAVSAATFDWADKPEGDKVAEFRLFVPDALKTVRAVVVVVPGFNGDGRGAAGDAAWTGFAERNQCALLGCSLRGGGVYYQAEVWTGKALLEALKNFAKDSAHPEIAAAPLAFWGHSAGGQFNYNFACWKPERTAAFIVNKGANYDAEPSPSVRKIPALWIAGGKDTELRIGNITRRYTENRKKGALWALAIEPNEGHGVGRSQELGMAFLEDALNLRLDSFGKLQPANPASGWLGDLQTHEVVKCTGPDSGDRKKSWLPGEASATLWREVTSAAAAAPAENGAE